MEFFGIRNKKTKEPIGFYCNSNENGECCVSVAFTLENADSTGNVWLYWRKETVERVLKTNTEWYNAGYASPGWGTLQLSDYEIFQVNIPA